MKQGRRWHLVAIRSTLLGAGLLAGLPLCADWLLTREGGRVETKGAWKVEGKLVVFTLINGTLSSLRLGEVDLEASRQATLAAAEAKTAESAKTPPAPRKSVRVLTDKDFQRTAPAAAAEAEAPADSGSAATPGNPEPASLAVQVSAWAQSYNYETNAMEITGQIRNIGPDLATAVSLTVRLYDDRGQEIASQQASLATRTLRTGQNTAFQAVFPGVNGFVSAKFEPHSVALMVKPPAAEGTPPPADGKAPAR